MADQPVVTVSPAAEPIPTLPEPDNRNQGLKESGLPSPQPLFPTLLPNQGPNPNTPPPPTLLFPPQSIQPYAAALSLRPGSASLPQFAPLPVTSNPNLPQAPSYSTSGGLPPPGVNAVPTALLGSASQVPVQSSMQLSIPPPSYAVLRPPYVLLPNGYRAIHQTASLPGIARFPPQYAQILRPPYPRPGTVFMPQFSRPSVPVIRPSILPPMVRPLPVVTIPEKLQITVYIGKISPTVENDFMLSILQLCGSVKSWKRPQDPTNGTLKSFGLYEFESPEGVLRALRLLSKLSIDGQELMVNVNKASRDFLERYTAKKSESYKALKEIDTESTKKDDEGNNNKNGTANSSSESPTETILKDDASTAKDETIDVDFGLVCNEDRQADIEALEKIKGMIEERLKNKPLPPPPAHTPTDGGTTKSKTDVLARSKDGEVDIDVTKDAAEDKNDNEMINDSKPTGDQDKSEISSPDRDRKHDRRRDRERDVKREKERELERYEREREQDRAKREKDREYRIREDERRFKAKEKEWEVREKEKEHWRKREKERDKDRAHERKLQVLSQERESQDGTYNKKWKNKSNDDERRKREREKQEDMADGLKEEEEEIVEAKKRQEEEEKLKHLSEDSEAVLSVDLTNTLNKDIPTDQIPEIGVNNHVGDETMQNGIGDESTVRNNNNANASSSRKLGFGLLGLGKRTSVPSVFKQDEDEDTHKEKKMRPLVPIDYSTEEHLEPSASEPLAAASEFAKHISGVVPKEEKYDMEKERNKRSSDRHGGQRDKDRNATNESSRNRDEIKKENYSRDHDRGYGIDKTKTPENRKLLDAKQLIDMIPKTKDELFSYEINWETYDRNALQERMKPWISKKITEFLGEEEATLVDYIVSSTREHVQATEMLERLSGILDEEAEMFVLKMWRMLIFEIKRVETGLALRSGS